MRNAVRTTAEKAHGLPASLPQTSANEPVPVCLAHASFVQDSSADGER